MAAPEAIPDHLQSEETLAGFIAQFEAGTLPAASWTHAAHVTVAASYLWNSNVDAVLPQMRVRIRAYNKSVGGKNTETSGYHESLTVFWLRVIDEYLKMSAEKTRLSAVRLAVRHFGPRRDLFKQYYGFDVVNSREARASWVPPDLRPL